MIIEPGGDYGADDALVYTYEFFNQAGWLCHRMRSWRLIEPALLNVFSRFGDVELIVLEHMRITGCGIDRRYRLMGWGHDGQWELEEDRTPELPKSGVKLVGGLDVKDKN
jgi:hypothetical protein